MPITGTEIVQFYSAGVFPSLQEMVYLPLTKPEILWTVLPLLVTAFFLELYFGRYKIEELGWNTAFGNCISLVWVTSALVRFMYELHGKEIFVLQWTSYSPTMLLILLLGVWSLTLAICNFFHVLQKWLSFFLSSTIPVNVSALVASILVLGQFPMDRVTGVATVIATIMLVIIFATIQSIMIPSKEAKVYIENYKKKAAELKKQRENAFYERVALGKERIHAQILAVKATILGFFHGKKEEKE